MAKVTEEVRKANEEKRRLLEEKQKSKAEAAAKKGEEAEKSLMQQTVDSVDQAKLQWAEGLDWEGKSNLTKADRAWRMSEAFLLTAKRNTEQLVKSNDVEVIKQSKDLDKDIDAWLIRTYYRLGRMWAAESRYADSVSWLNKGIRISPDDHLLNETLLTLTQMEMRKRANASAPKGY
jgi:tetratricopeptide (TPR) repeat protein